jgi:hypothetical protein
METVMKTNKLARPWQYLAASALCSLCLVAAGGAGAVTVTIINGDAAGEGFNDPTPATPVGGNTGTTLGQQRLNAFTYAANIWGSKLSSTVPIRILASFDPLFCTDTSATLGSAGATEVYADFPGAPRANTWYPVALANKLTGADLSAAGDPHIEARFNSRLGLAEDCMPDSPFYFGLDNNHGSAIDFVTVLLHEMGHGLGFQSFTDEETGELFFDTPSIWDHYLLDNRINQRWVNMTAEQRAASAVSGTGLSWAGPIVTAAVPEVLAPVSRLTVSGVGAGAAAGFYKVGDASFGPPLGTPPVSGQLMPVVDQRSGAGFACTTLSAANATAVRNNIALVDRGGCPFVDKARNVQAAGAIAMIVADNAPGDPDTLGGMDAAITIPAVRITQDAGVALRSALQRRSRTMSGVVASLGVNPQRLAGTDQQNRIRLYTPTVLESGSSVAHYTTDAKPNQLMEPALNGDLTHSVAPPRDLTLPLLRDIGW